MRKIERGKKKSDLKYRCKILIDVFGHRIGTSLAASLYSVSISRYSPVQILPFMTSTTTHNDHLLWGIVFGVILSVSGFRLGNFLVLERDMEIEKQKTD
jgi:H+/Cl- antiporter ClcA